jgi:gliding motility-associated-like protein
MRKIILLSVISIISISVFGQDFSNKGKDFWITSGYHYSMATGNQPVMTLSITSDVNTTYSVEAYGVGVFATGNIVANQVTNVNIPSNLYTTGNGLFNGKSIHVTAPQPIVVYSFITQSVSSAATLCLPTNVLGTQYYAASYSQFSQSPNANNFITIMAVDDNTTVEIIPTQTTAANWPANSVNLIPLNKGQIYQVLGQISGNTGSDLTGTSIRSVASGTGGCKRIAVFSGSGRVLIPNSCGNGADNLYQQLYPYSTWGKKYLTVPSANRPINYYRIIRPVATANVYLNGVLIPAGAFNNNFYEFNNTIPNLIEADTSICVAQYFTSAGCNIPGYPTANPNPYDPDMVILNPVEQNISDVTLISSDRLAHTPLAPQHHLHVIIKNSGSAISSFRFDGAAIPATANWVTHPADPAYSYLYLSNVSETYHSLKSDSGFNALAYGYASNETYAYSAGTNVRDPNQQLELNSPNGIETTPIICTGSPFGFKVYFPDKSGGASPGVIRYDSIRWDCNNTTVMTPNNFPVVIKGTPTVTPDSVNIRNGKDVAWYSIPGQYSFSTPGTYQITVTLYRTSTEGCGNAQEWPFELIIIDPPGGSFTHTTPGCYLEPVQFTETTPQFPKTTYKWFWDFGDGSPFSFAKDPSHTYTAAGTYTVRYAGVTTPGCVTDTISQQLIVPDVPSATITGATNVCLNGPSPSITFTGTGGVAPYQFTYQINGITQAPVTSNAGGTFTITGIPTNVAGPFTYNLIGVKNLNSTLCTRTLTAQAVINVVALPVAAISTGTTACLNGPSPTVTFTGSGGTAPYTFAYTINGTAQTPVVSNAAGIATIAAPTNIAGPFTYAITLITDGAATLCNQAYPNNSLSTLININALPAAAISATATSVCLNGPSPTVTFTGSGGTAPYTFNYTLNSVAQAPVVSNAGGTYTITVPTNVAIPLAYVLTSVREGSVNACNRPLVTGQSATVTVNPLPAAAIAGATTVCLNAPSPTVTFTGSGGTAPYTFAYTINGTAQAPVISNGAGVATVPAATNVSAPLLYAVTLVTDATATLCSQAYTNNSVSTVINVTPLPSAAIAGATTVCINGPSPNITFTGSGGAAPYTFTYSINAVTQAPVVSNGAGVYTIAAPTTVAGPFTYRLLSVQESGPNTCIQPNVLNQQAIVQVNALPAATISSTATSVCLNGPSPTVTFTGTGGTAPYTFNYTLNSVAQAPVVSNAGGTYTITVPTNVAIPLAYVLTGVREGSVNACNQPLITGQSATVTVNPLPTAAITGSTTVCMNAPSPSVILVGSGSVAPYTFNYTINGVPQTPVISDLTGAAILTVPTNASGPFTYAITSVSDATPAGCSQGLNNVTTTVNVTPLPTAAIAGATTVCINGPSPNITFTGSGGAAPYTFTYSINAVTQAPVVSNGAGVYTIAAPTTAAGPFTYRLLSVQESGPNTCIQPNVLNQQAIVQVNPLPIAAIAAATTDVCLNAASPLITFTGSAGTAPYTFSYTRNGIAQTPVVSNNAGVATVAVPTTAANSFVYVLTSVSDGTVSACSQNQAGTVTVIVHPLPTALISGNIEVCQNAASPAVTFTGAGGTAPYTFTYSVNGGSDVTVTTTAGNSVTVLQPTTTVNTFTYVLKSVQDATVSLCNQVQTGTVTVKVNPLPTAAISGTKLICINSASPDITFTGAGGTTPYTFRYRINGGGLLTVSTTGTNTSVTLPVATNIAGTFTYTMEDVRDGSPTACLQAQTGNAVIDISSIFPNALFDFSDTVCLPNALVQFQNQSTIANGTPNSMTYLWNFGDGSPTSTGFAPSHRYNAVGPFTATLQATSIAGCVTTIPIAVNSIHAQPKAAFSINKPGGVCIGDNVLLTDLSDPKDGTTDKWNWDMGVGPIITTNPVTYTYTTATTYTIKLYSVNSFGCNSDTVSQQFTVHPFPVVDAGPDGVVLEGGSYTMQPTVTGNDLQYLWSPANFLNSITIKAPTATGMLDDITYKLVVTGRGGCEAPADFVFIKVLKAPKVPNTFTPNGDGINELWLIDYLDTYPNCKVQVFTRTGQSVFESKGYKTPWNGKLNGKPLPFDTYYYIIEPGNNRAPITGYVTIVK